jgi:glycine/D-amino acid oxidase-like deaminating enzyme
MHIDSSSIDQDLNFQNDIVILGGGISGIFLAYLLQDTKKNIVIVDHGSLPDLRKNISRENDIIQTGIHHDGILIKNKTVGGWSNLWGGLLTELSKIDLEKNYWGLNYEELNNLYKEIYNILYLIKNYVFN